MGWKTERLTKHHQKDGEGWLLNDEQRVICRFSNDLPSAHAKWIRVETRPFRGGRATVRRMLRQNAIDAWTHMLKTGWKRCPPRW